jgi:phosphatidylglycerophosphate synthase
VAFQLTLRLPGGGGDNPAFARVAGVAVLLRLAIGAVRGGARHISIVGEDIDRARDLLRSDERLEGIGICFGEQTDIGLPQVDARADVVVGTRVWKLLDEAHGAVSVPGAPLMEKLAGDRESPRPLWEGPAPQGCYAVTVSDPAGRRAAKREIFRHITKPTSGPVSRHLNSRLSIPLSKILVETPMTPNQMTVVNTVIGVIAAVYYSLGDLASVAIGGLIMQLSSALDRNDGELARSKFMESDRGAWFDSVGDNITYVAFMLGLTIGYSRFTADNGLSWAAHIPLVGFGTILLAAALIGGMFFYVYKNNLGGTMTAISHDFSTRVDRRRAGPVFRLLDRLSVLGERDQFSLALMAISAMPYLTGNAAWYHALFFTTFGFVLAANLYFTLGWLAGRGRRQAANHA